MRLLSIIAIAVATAAFGPAASSQTRCPGGATAGSAQCMPDDDDDAGPPRPTGRWIKTWGALVSSNQAGGSWSSKQKYSEEEASNDALSRCKETGATDCNVDKTYFNQCVGVAADPTAKRGVFFNTGKNEKIAQNRAVEYCAKETGHRCKPMFSECSDAVFEKF